MYVLNPTSVALIGASAEAQKLGHFILENLIKSGFKGEIYPVNPKHDEMMGRKCFHAVTDIPGDVDMAVVVTPAATVAAITEECGKKGVKTLVVISAGFGELGTDDGRAREKELTDIAAQYKMSIVGPNCLGVLRPSIGLNASFATTPEEAGKVALISQSGAMAVALLDQAAGLHLHFSLVASIGNKADLDESDFLEICEKDPETKVIGLYLESIKNGQRFIEAAKRVGTTKPIVLIKSGTSSRGAKAVASHTGALAGSRTALDAACIAAGIHRAGTTQEFLALLTMLATQPPLLSNSIAIVTNAGGPGVLATDAAERAGLTIAGLDPRTVATLKAALPAAASTANPVDVLGDALADGYALAIDACAKDLEVDGLVLLLTPQVMTPCEDIARAIVELKKTHPLLPMVTSFVGGEHVQSARALLRQAGIPSFGSPEEAVNALSTLLPRSTESVTEEEHPRADDRSSAAHGLLKGQSGLLSEDLTDELLKLYGLPTPDQAVARSEDEAAQIAEAIGLPVIAKVSSPDILHKTDVGGIKIGLETAADVKKAYKEILASCKKNCPSAAIRGVLIQKFLPAGSEFIIGAIRDQSFGPMVMVGLGGIYTELFKDTCFRMAPVSGKQAYAMLTELKAWPLLTGMRGKAPLNIDSLADAVVQISQLMSDCPRIQEMDMNPVLLTKDGLTVADAKVVVR